MEDTELEIVLPWDDDGPTRPVISFRDERLVFLAQLDGDRYAKALLALADRSKRSDFLLAACVPEGLETLESLLADTEEGIGAVVASRISAKLASHYGMLGAQKNGERAVDPTKSESQQSSARKRRSGASDSGKNQG